MKYPIEENLPYAWLAIIVLAVFYAIYFASYGMQEKRDFVFVTALLISVESRVLIMIFN